MKRWPLIIMAVIWLGLGVLLSWTYGLGAHGGEHGPTEEVQAGEAASGH